VVWIPHLSLGGEDEDGAVAQTPGEEGAGQGHGCAGDQGRGVQRERPFRTPHSWHCTPLWILCPPLPLTLPYFPVLVCQTPPFSCLTCSAVSCFITFLPPAPAPLHLPVLLPALATPLFPALMPAPLLLRAACAPLLDSSHDPSSTFPCTLICGTNLLLMPPCVRVGGVGSAHELSWHCPRPECAGRRAVGEGKRGLKLVGTAWVAAVAPVGFACKCTPMLCPGGQ